MNKVTLLKGDCLQKLKGLKDNSVDSVVTDPPYEIGFMGKGWDDSGIANNPKLWKEVLRVLKPGGHLLSFSHSRTYHRQAVAVEDAGFEIRDQIMWIYGSGFPKSHNIGKSVDKLQGNEREFVGLGASQPAKSGHFAGSTADSINYTEDKSRYNPPVTKGNSPYEGWGTALKPAHEPIVMARKPLSEKTVAKNVLEYGTGGINIDGCRVSSGDDYSNRNSYTDRETNSSTFQSGGQMKSDPNELGRFPANIIFDEEDNKEEWRRYFYCPKASKKDRDGGMEQLQSKSIKGRDEGQDKTSIAYKARPTERKNIHPTVKPTDLMAYLVRLVTPKGGVVLDPFMGSGSTGKASVREGFDFIGIEREDEYMEIAKTRIQHEQKKHNYKEFFNI
jgi:DNA modification methylase